MTIGSMLMTLIIGPLKMLFELIYALAHRFVSPGLSIFALSLCMNLLVLPLYRRADAIQEEERATEARLAPGVAHIRKTFQGDQRFMTLQTYYRQNHYSQAHALKGLLPLMLEIPFFIAAYQFLSGLELLNGAAFGPIRDLSLPDGLISIGGVTVNLLPVLMTAVNILSGAVYTRGAPLKSRIQLYAMAAVFLVLLYNSPAGLTLYWTLNNLFALVKNLVIRLPRRERRPREGRKPAWLARKPKPAMFFLAAAFAAVLTGGLIPSAVIVSSPSEFVETADPMHPFWYIAGSLLLGIGTFPGWLGVYYLMAKPGTKKGMELALWVLDGLMILNYMAFRPEFGLLNSVLQYENLPAWTAGEKLINLGILAAAAAVLAFVWIRWEGFARGVCLTGVIAVCAMTWMNADQSRPMITNTIAAIRKNQSQEMSIPLSRTGKNVIVLMLDRAVSRYVPCVFAEKPELEASYDGFVWYANTLSHGAFTNFGTPGLFGGYEYTPWESNQRTDRLLLDKHDEALRVMPKLFGGRDWEVTVVDPPYAGNYAFVPDLSIYDGMENVTAYQAVGKFDYRDNAEVKHHLRFRNFFSYALFRVSPRAVMGTLYNAGFYNELNASLPRQERESISVSTGLNEEFRAYEGVLSHLPGITELREEGNTLLLLTSEITHNPTLLQAPEYEAAYRVDNREYDAAHGDRFLAGPDPLEITTEEQMIHYHVNIAAYSRLSAWLDWMKENGVYDNTRIILVSDHGFGLGALGGKSMKDGEDLMFYNALLMVKDFDSHGKIRQDDAFMTNADVPALAAEGVLENPVNPFTGREIGGDAWKAAPQKVTFSHEWSTITNNKEKFSRSKWYEMEEEVLNPEKWTFIGEY